MFDSMLRLSNSFAASDVHSRTHAAERRKDHTGNLTTEVNLEIAMSAINSDDSSLVDNIDPTPEYRPGP